AGAYQLPKDADVVWKDDWTSWEDFLGVTLTFEAGREVARTMEVATEDDYMRLMKSKTIPEEDVASRLPFRPDLMYKDNWNGWDDFLVGDASGLPPLQLASWARTRWNGPQHIGGALRVANNADRVAPIVSDGARFGLMSDLAPGAPVAQVYPRCGPCSLDSEAAPPRVCRRDRRALRVSFRRARPTSRPVAPAGRHAAKQESGAI
ncbi:hypothetical protein THAOC_01406, partial [Thalassiosira oceanica]